LPAVPRGIGWSKLIDTAQDGEPAKDLIAFGSVARLDGRTVALLCLATEADKQEGWRPAIALSTYVALRRRSCPNESVRFRLWAPAQSSVSVVVETAIIPRCWRWVPLDDGRFELTTDRATAGSR